MMKRNLRPLLFAAFLLFFALFAGTPTRTSHAATASQAECVVEVSSLRLLHERGAEARLPMASTTKILTAIMIIDDCDLEETITIPKEAEGIEGSSVYLRAGDEFTVRDLLYGLMLRSGNDCAVALALHHSGSVEAFAEAMTAKATLLGAEDSHFTNPHGLPDEDHYTTARDLALITAYAMKNETFREIVSCKFYEPKGWKNKNRMLWEFDGAIGVKTGYTVRAGRCLVSGAERDGMTLVSVVLNSPDMFERSKELLNSAFSRYTMVQLCDSSLGYEGYRILEDFSYPLTEEEKDKINIKSISTLPFPEAQGDFAGQIMIYLGNDLLFSQNLYIL